jgi:peptidoglycan/LPS O-acetylase OafA/YrhL
LESLKGSRRSATKRLASAGGESPPAVTLAVPWLPFTVAAAICALTGAGLFVASQSSQATLWFEQRGIDPYKTSAELALAMAVSLCLSASPTARAAVVGAGAWLYRQGSRVLDDNGESHESHKLPARAVFAASDKPEPENKDQWAVLAGARFVLALAVMLHHVTGYVPLADPLHGADFGGIPSVMGFFVISGYSMANSLSRDGDARRFYERRFWRIYPSYLFAIALAAVPCLLLNNVFPTAQPGFHQIPDLRQFLCACVFMQGFITPGDLPANGVIWSLSCEVWLYAFCPLLFRASLKWLKVIALCSIGFYVAHGWYDKGFFYADSYGIAFLSFAWAFIGGFAYYKYSGRSWSTPALIVAGVALTCIGNREVYGPVNFALVIAVVAAARHIKLNPNWRKPLIFAGNLSYPLYLVHVPVLNYLYGLGFNYGIGMACAAIAVALAVRCGIEAPIEWYQKRARSRRDATPAVPAPAHQVLSDLGGTPTVESPVAVLAELDVEGVRQPVMPTELESV